MPLTRHTLPSQEFLRECFLYDPETGVLSWKVRPREHFTTNRAYGMWNTRYAGKPVCVEKSGYLYVGLVGARFYAHRVIWKLMTGEEPPDDVDHSDRDRTNNRWSNLRKATRQQTAWNSNRTKNATGFRGVFKRGRRYGAQARINNGNVRLGYFDTPEEASAAYIEATIIMHGEFYAHKK
jgi:hypothetical protein